MSEERKKVRKTVAMSADEMDRRKRVAKDSSIVPTVTVIEGKNLGARLKIIKPNYEYIIGRAQHCNLSLDDDSVSREHSKIWREDIEEQGEKNIFVQIQDLGSTNKTLLNGQEVESAYLAAGVKISLGDTILLFELLDPIIDKFYQSIFSRARKANIDPLTQLLSKQFFLETLPDIYNEALANGQEFSIIIIDIDHFKQLNDTFGHDAGDEALKMIAQLIRATIRKEDLAIRYGGDEIVIALPGANGRNAFEVAQRLQVNLKNYQHNHVAEELSFSISMGISTRQNHQNVMDLTRAADRALYVSKHEGRNRIRAADC